MKITVPVAAAVALALALPAAVDAAPTRVVACDAATSPNKTGSCKSGGKKDAKRTFAALAGAWRVVAIDVDGTTTASDSDPDITFTMAGTTKVRYSGSKSGRFEDADDLVATSTIKPIDTVVTSKATLETGGEGGPYDCELQWTPAIMPKRLTVPAGPSREFADALTFQWNFTPSGWGDCVRGDDTTPAPSPPMGGSDLASMTYPASAFRNAKKGKDLRLKVNIDRTSEEGDITVRQTWKGSVTVRATR